MAYVSRHATSLHTRPSRTALQQSTRRCTAAPYCKGIRGCEEKVYYLCMEARIDLFEIDMDVDNMGWDGMYVM
jgi:hypothetical protein